MREQITEEMKIHEVWYKEAKNMTLEGLPEFINHLMNDYEHDYGTICHAMTAGGIATMEAINNSDQGGITGFQDPRNIDNIVAKRGALFMAGAIIWRYRNNKTGLKLVDYDNFLYPQYEENFRKTIGACTWAAIQKEAATQIKEADEQHEKYLVDSEKYEQDIAVFTEKHPEYSENPKKYDHLDVGNAAEWDEEDSKIKNGFEFAPTKPYDGPYGNAVYQHWTSIVSGVVPFGYTVVDDE